MPKLTHTDIDRNMEVAGFLALCPLCQLRAGSFQCPFTQRQDKTAVLCLRNKVIWIHQTPLRMLPAHQGFNPKYMPTQTDLRLVKEQKFIHAQALTQIGMKSGIRGNNSLHGWIKKTKRIASRRFSLIHRQISLLEQITHVLFAFAEQCHTDAACAFVLKTCKVVRLTQCEQDSLRHAPAVFSSGQHIIRQAFQHHDELVTTQSCHGIA